MSYAIPTEVQDGQFLRTKKYIATMLGFPQVSVTINEHAFNIAIEDALEYWYKYMSSANQYMVVDYYMFETTGGQSLYLLPDCIDPGKVRSVIYNPQNYSLFNIAFNQNFDFLFFTTQEQVPELTTFYLALQKQEFVNMVLGQQGTYDIIGSPPSIHLMPTPEANISVAIMYQSLPSEATLEKIGWIRRYALASAKTILGEIFSRYSNMPQGMGDMQLNGQELKQEGKEEKAMLLEEIKQATEAYYIQTDFESW